MSRYDDEVDAFGRSINRGSRGGQNNYDIDRRDSLNDSVLTGEKQYKKPQKSLHRHQDHQKMIDPVKRYSDDAITDGRGSNNGRNRQGGQQLVPHNQGSPRQYRQQSNELVPQQETAEPARITPFMGFKSFMNHQKEDCSSEMCQKLYEQYHMHYIDDFSRAFFHASKSEEWFQERYNPVKIVAQKKEVQKWSAKEAAEIMEQMQSNAVEELRGMCLDPVDTLDLVTANDDDDDEDDDTPRVKRNPANSKCTDGHIDRTILLNGIHACCPKEFLMTSINEYLTSKGCSVPLRYAIGEPIWSKKNLEQFERWAWLIMPTVESVMPAIGILKDYSIEVPSVADPLTGERRPLFSFRLNALPHKVLRNTAGVKAFNNLPSYHSDPERVYTDTDRAARLASLMDELSDVPVDSRLSAILELPQVVSSLKKPTDRLDLSIAYLRRVHFISFYGGKLFNTEAQLLQFSQLYRRSFPCSEVFVPAPDSEPLGRIRGLSNASETGEVVDATTPNKKRKLEDESEEATGQEGNENDDAAVTTPSNKKNDNNSSVRLVDHRIERLILQLKDKLEAKQQVAYGIIPPSGEDVDAEVIARQQEETYSSCVRAKVINEKDSKARCCYEFCKKLFKDVDFLTRHLKSKHEDFALSELVAISEPYMLRNFESEDIFKRPLPPIEMEHSRELKTVSEIYDRYIQLGRDKNNRFNNRHDYKDSNYDRRNNYDHDNRRYGEGGGNRGGGDRQIDHSQRGNDDRDLRSHRQKNADYDRDTAPRKPLANFMDVDAPKESVGAVDYGVTLPPPVKRRKSVGKPETTETTA